MHVVDKEQGRDRPQSPCALKPLRRPYSTDCIYISCAAPSCIYPVALDTRPIVVLKQAAWRKFKMISRRTHGFDIPV